MAVKNKNNTFEERLEALSEDTVVTPELISKYILGIASFDECLSIAIAIDKYPWVKKMIRTSIAINKAVSSKILLANPFGVPISRRISKPLPALCLAASSEVNDCVVKCEHYVLKSIGKEAEYQQLYKDAIEHKWLRESGTPLYNIGRLLEMAKMSVARKFRGTLEMVKKELDGGCSVIVAINVEKLTQKCSTKDVVNHAVVVLDINIGEGYVELYDPQSSNQTDHYAIDDFLRAWKPSKNYFVSIIERGIRPYTPHPEYVAHIKLDEDLLPLVDMFAENAHEIWAIGRLNEAEEKKKKGEVVDFTIQYMKPFNELTEEESKTDYSTAVNTIKLLYKLGFRLSEKPNDNSPKYKFESNVRTADGEYIPRIIPVDDIVLPDEIAELTEYIAENVHEEWAKQRLKEGWKYAPKKNEALKQSQALVPYCELLDSEKDYDRKMAMYTLKVLYKLGYKIEKDDKK